MSYKIGLKKFKMLLSQIFLTVLLAPEITYCIFYSVHITTLSKVYVLLHTAFHSIKKEINMNHLFNKPTFFSVVNSVDT